MKQLVSRIMIGVTLVVAYSLAAMPQLAKAEQGAAKVCHTLTHNWSGNVNLVKGQSFSTGLSVEEQLGIQSIVTSAAVATDTGSPTSLSIQIGEAVASTGAVVRGGLITVTNVGPDAQNLTSVDVIMQHCHSVAVADALTAPATALKSPNLRASEAPQLPATGAASPLVAGLGALLVGAGVAMVVMSRRRRIA